MTGLLNKRLGREVTGPDYLRVRAMVVHDNPAWKTRSYARHVSLVVAETERRLKADGYIVRGVNEPPPWWSKEYDRREELLALSELAAARKVG